VPTGAIIMFAVAFAVAALTHWKVKKILLASAVSTIVSPVVFLLVSIFQAGLPEQFSPTDILVLSGMALPPSLVVGLVFYISRRIIPNSS